jgi:hypothetical protein
MFKVFMLFVLSAAFLYSKPTAVVIKANGNITISKKSGKTSDAKRGTTLEDGDEIKTGNNGRLAVKFLDDNSLLRIRPNSSCIINTTKEQNSVAKNILVEVGTIFTKVTAGPNTSFKVTTPTSVASVKGTAYWTVQKLKGSTQYFGDEGSVEISNDAGLALMKAGETGIVASKNSLPIIRKTKPGESPTLDDGDAPDEFEFEFENDSGSKKLLKFKAKNVQE